MHYAIHSYKGLGFSFMYVNIWFYVVILYRHIGFRVYDV